MNKILVGNNIKIEAYMKKIVYFFIMICSLFFSSCLTNGLEELPVYEDADITSVVAVKYRYISDEKSPASGDYLVKEVDLIFNPTIDKEDEYVKIDVSLPENFPVSEIDKVSKSNLLVIVNVSPAARLFPVKGAPALGTPGNWENPNKYKIQSASGIEKQWTIEVTDFNK